jgi:hypothetical protein
MLPYSQRVEPIDNQTNRRIPHKVMRLLNMDEETTTKPQVSSRENYDGISERQIYKKLDNGSARTGFRLW